MRHEKLLDQLTQDEYYNIYNNVGASGLPFTVTQGVRKKWLYHTRDGEEITYELVKSYQEEYELKNSISKTDKTKIRNSL